MFAQESRESGHASRRCRRDPRVVLTRNETRALLFFTALLLVGAGIRVARLAGALPNAADAERGALARQIREVEAARLAKTERGSARSGARTSSGGRVRRTTAGGGTRAPDAAERSARAAAEALAAREALEEAWRAGHAASGAASHGSTASSLNGRVAPPGSAGAREPRADPVDLDTATPSQLEKLPRIGPALARRIVEDRKRNGPFGSLQGFQRVRGIGPKMVEQLQGRVTFSGRRQE
jgi:DNA uptake protein ComE-like DNA-binding protein